MITIPGYSRPPSYFARNISLSPAGNISSTTLQAGIEELDSEKTTESYVNAEVASVPTGSKNLLYNGAMQVAQRGTSSTGITTSDYYTVDRWKTVLGTTGTWTQTVENDAPTGSGFRKSSKLLCTTADAAPAAADLFRFETSLEGQDVQRICQGTANAKPLTLSFWVKGNVTGTYIIELRNLDASRSISASYSISASATWEKKVVTFPADTTGAFDNDNNQSLVLHFYLAVGSDYSSGTLQTSWGSRVVANSAVGQTNLAAATNNYWQITGVQLEVGDTATEFEHLPHGVELARCQRYFYAHVSSNAETIGVGTMLNSSALRVIVPFPVTMRTKPSLISASGTGYFAAYINSAGLPITDFTAGAHLSTNSIEINATVSSTGGYSGRVTSSVSDAYLWMNAEL